MTSTDNTAMGQIALTPAVCFPTTYAQGRAQFLAAARAAGAELQHHVLPGHRGRQGEELALDAALLTAQSDGNGQAPLLIVSSGVHGVEGLCGSGCQQHLLHDAELGSLDLGQRIRVVHAGQRRLPPTAFDTVASATLHRQRLWLRHFNRATGQPAVAGIANAVAFAWAIAVTFPVVIR